ncbi:MAG: anthranilate synthase component I [Anaerolineae bacterium]|jgi:anthranilate synthase component I|nr:anthranilate synthase component I [Anaerolineae bacterium]MBT7071933.1 anthranilate synthase component I [Anaerolineae bacterium]MBT7323947.1 anthranilate synthase component I [Anaerolineae bacterium]
MKKNINHTAIPIVRELPADLETPISVYLKLSGNKGPSFLLESVTGGEHVARYSFLGTDLQDAFVLKDQQWEMHSSQGVDLLPLKADQTPLEVLRDYLGLDAEPKASDLPRFSGGLVGYMGFETVRYFEPTLPLIAHSDLPEAIFLLADTVIAFDHAYGKLLLIATAHSEEEIPEAEARLDALEASLESPLPDITQEETEAQATDLESNFTFDEFCENVEEAKEHIAAGDIFQVVLSQRLSRETSASPFEIYRSLRRINPSPYMFFFDFAHLTADDPFYLIGASPEIHVRLEDSVASLRPIAGTRPRGATPEEDQNLADELLSDPKERAEHVMLVDLGRNDLGRVCEYGTVKVPEQLLIERYSHVMHIVSHVEGQIRPEFDAFDLLEATFPAGTVSGAPKVRAMEIIHKLEKEPRGVYAGAVGYISYDGSSDTCIAIRTMVMQGQEISVQAGAGIVADSVPATEYQESINKAKALFAAVEKAEHGRNR